MIGWARDALAALETGPRVALVTVLAVEGSAPRDAGTRMVVTPERLIGTIGGGNLEHQAARQARALLEQPVGQWRVQDYPLGPFLGQCCGGRVRLMLEHLDPGDRGWLDGLMAAAGPVALATRLAEGRLEHRLAGEGAPACARGPSPGPGDVLSETVADGLTPVWVFGAGHVGQALARALAPLPFAARLIDVRQELSGMAEVVGEDQAAALIGQAPSDAAVLVMTHDHGLDYRLTGAALAGDARFVGLIGSATKRVRFLRRLARDGMSEAQLARMVCPIGLPGIEGKEPAVIAASVAAQLLGLR